MSRTRQGLKAAHKDLPRYLHALAKRPDRRRTGTGKTGGAADEAQKKAIDAVLSRQLEYDATRRSVGAALLKAIDAIVEWLRNANLAIVDDPGRRLGSTTGPDENK